MIIAKINAKLVANWREFWRWWSFQLGSLGTLLAGWFIMFPESAVHAWAFLPDDMKAILPPQFVGYAGMILFVLSLISKMVKQKKLPSNQQ